MSRLTEREPHWLGEEFWVSAQEPDEEELDEVYMKLKHYEDLEEQGRLITLPCKVGDTVWWVDWEYNEYFGREYYIDESTFDIEDFSSLGNLCFLTKEEAEAKLAELKGTEE